jgi:hypothetical protein
MGRTTGFFEGLRSIVRNMLCLFSDVGQQKEIQNQGNIDVTFVTLCKPTMKDSLYVDLINETPLSNPAML